MTLTFETPPRTLNAQLDTSNVASSFVLGKEHKSYRHQFANLYFARLTILKSIVEKRAREKWGGVKGEPPLVPRVLDVEKSQVCFIVGTVYLEMPQKPNVLEDLGRDRYLPEPPPRTKYISDEDAIMLEDDSGRVQLVGDALKRSVDPEEGGQGWGNLLVTGVIMAALGHESDSGSFEVSDVCFAGIAPMLYKHVEAAMDVDETESSDRWVGFVSGLQIDENSMSDLKTQLLLEFLSGEGGTTVDSAADIQRLVVVGNSLAASTLTEIKVPTETNFKSKRFGQEQSNYSNVPVNNLGDILYEVASAMPVHLLAGASDPSGSLLPQQSLPRAMFGDVKKLENFHCETNPTWLGIEGDGMGSSAGRRSILVHSGQALDDMYKYVPTPPVARIDLACNSLVWRHMAPTAPDTLWCYPYLTTDPFVLHHTPDIYAVGCQPEFATRLLSTDESEAVGEDGRRRCRVVLVPEFKTSSQIVLVNLRSLDVKCITFESNESKDKQS